MERVGLAYSAWRAILAVDNQVSVILVASNLQEEPDYGRNLCLYCMRNLFCLHALNTPEHCRWALHAKRYVLACKMAGLPRYAWHVVLA